ncbi:MAG: hypothetical protein M5R40_23535 [Anaerolineae bacterium]|nr:hypothetical protein [Anaerolineae bacterium]
MACAVCRSCGHLMLQVDPEQLKELERATRHEARLRRTCAYRAQA